MAVRDSLLDLCITHSTPLKHLKHLDLTYLQIRFFCLFTICSPSSSVSHSFLIHRNAVAYRNCSGLLGSGDE